MASPEALGERIEVEVAVVGAGQAAVPLVRALHAKGRAVVLVEREHLGGSCVNFGCTPSKAVIASARAAAAARAAGPLGVAVGGVEVDFGHVIERARDFAASARGGLDEAFAAPGAPRLVRGHARMWGREGSRFRLLVDDGPEILADAVVLDTGTRTRPPPIEGLDEIAYVTAETWLDLRELPGRLIMLGSGAVGLELAQVFRRLGAEVTIVEHAPRLAAAEEPAVSEALATAFAREGIAIRVGAKVRRASHTSAGVRLELADGAVEGDVLFVAAGRQPNLEALGLDSVGLAPSEHGVLEVDEHLQTRVQGLYGAGDIRGGPQFTHTAWDDHRILLASLADGPPHTTRRVVPYAIFTEPEVGRVGLDEAQAKASGTAHRVGEFAYGQIAKAREDGRDEGFIRLVVDPAGERLLGATVVGEGAAELVHLFSLLMHLGAPLAAFRAAIFSHPTLGEGAQSAVAALQTKDAMAC